MRIYTSYYILIISGFKQKFCIINLTIMEKCSFMQFKIYIYHCYHACKKCNIYLNHVYKMYIPTYRWTTVYASFRYGLCIQFYSRHYNNIRYMYNPNAFTYLFIIAARITHLHLQSV